MPRRLAPDALEATVKMFEAGVRAEEIGDILGVSPRAVLWRLARRGLHYRRHRTRAAQLAFEMRRGHIHRLRGRGLPIAKMAIELRLRPRSLRAWMARNMPELYVQMKGEVRAAIAARAASRRASRPSRPERSHPDDVVRPAPLSHAQRRVIPEHYRYGYSIRAIARHFRQHRGTIWRLLRRSGVAMRPRSSRSPRWLEAMRGVRETMRAGGVISEARGAGRRARRRSPGDRGPAS